MQTLKIPLHNRFRFSHSYLSLRKGDCIALFGHPVINKFNWAISIASIAAHFEVKIKTVCLDCDPDTMDDYFKRLYRYRQDNAKYLSFFLLNPSIKSNPQHLFNYLNDYIEEIIKKTECEILFFNHIHIFEGRYLTLFSKRLQAIARQTNTCIVFICNSFPLQINSFLNPKDIKIFKKIFLSTDSFIGLGRYNFSPVDIYSLQFPKSPDYNNIFPPHPSLFTNDYVFFDRSRYEYDTPEHILLKVAR
ncbi:MAG: hypothetical protein K2H46_01595 [Muribaculaceae bacterium]|nr:hypothetical protein [Muribaculaceae bacterium]